MLAKLSVQVSTAQGSARLNCIVSSSSILHGRRARCSTAYGVVPAVQCGSRDSKQVGKNLTMARYQKDDTRAPLSSSETAEVTVEEIMVPHPVIFRETMPVKEAARIMLDKEISGAPVVSLQASISSCYPVNHSINTIRCDADMLLPCFLCFEAGLHLLVCIQVRCTVNMLSRVQLHLFHLLWAEQNYPLSIYNHKLLHLHLSNPHLLTRQKHANTLSMHVSRMAPLGSIHDAEKLQHCLIC